jgi:hypothetical protein
MRVKCGEKCKVEARTYCFSLSMLHHVLSPSPPLLLLPISLFLPLLPFYSLVQGELGRRGTVD